MRHFNLSVLGAALAVIGGCASAPAARQSLVRAEASINDAEQAGAYEQAGEQLRLARTKLGDARKALDDGDKERAKRLATEAALDAELASAITSNRETQASLREVNDAIATLRREVLQDSQE